MAAFGVLWLIVEPLGLFLGGDWSRRGWPAYGGLVLLSVIAGYLVTLPKLPIERALAGSKVMVRIAEGSLLDQTGNLVVGFNDCLDTSFDQGIISPLSLQGRVLTEVYGGDIGQLDGDLDRAVQESHAIGTAAAEKSYGKKVRFPIGTTLVVPRNRQRFFFVVYGRMPDRPPVQVQVEKDDFHVALVRVWESVRASGQREELHVPLLGGNFARFRSTRTQLVQTIALSYIAAQGPAEVAPAMTLWLLPQEASEVDLPALKVWLDSVCGA